MMNLLEIAMIDDLSQRFEGIFSSTKIITSDAYSVGDTVVPFMGGAHQHSENNYNVCRSLYPGYVMQYTAVAKNVWAYCGKASATSTSAVMGLVHVDGEKMHQLFSSASKAVISGGVVNVVSVGTSLFFLIEAASGTVTIWHATFDPVTNTFSTPASVGSIPFTFTSAMFNKINGLENVYVVGAGSGTDTVTFIKFNEGGTIVQSTSTSTNTKHLQYSNGHICYCPTTGKLYGQGYYTTEYAFITTFNTDTLAIGSISTMTLPAEYNQLLNMNLICWYDSELDAIGIIHAPIADSNTAHLIYVDPTNTSTLKNKPINIGKEAIFGSGVVSRIVNGGDSNILIVPTKDNPRFIYSVEHLTKKVTRHNNPLYTKSGANTDLFVSKYDSSMIALDNYSTYQAVIHASVSAYVNERAQVISIDEGAIDIIQVKSEVGEIKRIENIYNTAATTLRLSPFNIAKTHIYPPIQNHTMDIFPLAANSYQIIEYK